MLKYTVDSLNLQNKTEALLAVPIALIIAYGALRLSNVLLGEIRNTLFGRVTERAMRRVGLKVFKHLHRLDLNFHLNRQTPHGVRQDQGVASHGIAPDPSVRRITIPSRAVSPRPAALLRREGPSG